MESKRRKKVVQKQIRITELMTQQKQPGDMAEIVYIDNFLNAFKDR